MTTAQVVETSVTVNNNSPIQDYVHPDDRAKPTYEMTPGFNLLRFYIANIFLFLITLVVNHQNTNSSLSLSFFILGNTESSKFILQGQS